MNDNENVKIKLERHRWPDEIEKERKKRRGVIIVVLAVLLSFGIGWTFGDVFNRSSTEAVSDSNIARFERAYRRILNNWYFVNDMENAESQLVENAIKGMISLNGDIHTSYMTQEESADFASSIDMTFVGIGVQYYPGDRINLITRVYKNSPADRAGILAGDVLYSVDDVIVANIAADDDIKNYILGEEGSTVKVNVERKGKILSFDIVRGQVNALTWGEMLDNEIAYLEISSFGSNLKESTKVYLEFFKQQGAKKLIIDLRDNGGGYLEAINNLSELFFETDTVIYSEQFTNGSEVEYKVESSDKKNYPYDEIILLVNENSASASEVFALAIRENLNVKLVGTTTYGKGTVQTQIRDGYDNSYLKYTMAKWYSPNGVNIHGVGIVPDFEVKLPEIFYAEYVTMAEGESVGFDTVNPVVAYVQKGLKFLGYHTGRTDSYYDSATRDALLQFKQSNGLAQNDEINEEIVKRVYASVLAEWSQNKKTHDVQLQKAIEVIRNGS